MKHSRKTIRDLRLILYITLFSLISAMPSAQAQINWDRAAKALASTAQAVTLSDEQMSAYVHQYVQEMDSAGNTLPADNRYVKRLARLTQGISSVDGVPLNFKVYKKDEINAFACADGSVRVYTGLMDAMTDDEVLGVIGHEMGHVAKHHSKNAFKKALLRSAFRDGVASTSATMASLSDSQLSQLGEALASASFSKKQEKEADDYGYAFLKANGKDPRAMIYAFRKLQALQGQNVQGAAGKLNQLFSSHPDIKERIKRMEKQCRKDGLTVPSSQK